MKPELTREEVEKIIKAIEGVMKSGYGNITIIVREGEVLEIRPTPYLRFKEGNNKEYAT